MYSWCYQKTFAKLKWSVAALKHLKKSAFALHCNSIKICGKINKSSFDVLMKGWEEAIVMGALEALLGLPDLRSVSSICRHS